MVLLLSAPAIGQSNTTSANITEVTYAGDGNASVQNGGLFLWHAASHQFTVTVTTHSDIDANVCLLANASGQELGCAQTTIPANTTEQIAVGVGQLPANMTGERTVSVVLRDSNSSASIDQQPLTLTVLRADGDLDGDGLTDQREVSVGTAPMATDTDGDGLSDEAEVLTHETSPLNADSDRDGLSDGAEIKQHLTNPMRADSDGDGLLDSLEIEAGASPYIPDSDGDGITDAVEVNTYGTDPTSADTDGDGLDDGAELNTYRTNPMESDTDGDGISDALEVNTYRIDPGNPDTDTDGLLDGIEVNDYQTDPGTADTDSDGLHDGAEVNTYKTNPLNADTDGDGLNDGAEVNRYGTDPATVDTDADGTNDKLEAQTGLFPDIRWPGLVAAGIVLTLTGVLTGFYWANSRLPGQRAIASLRARLRSTERPPDVRRKDDDPAAETTADAGEKSETPDVSERVPPELLSNTDRVLQLLDEHDGRVRQSELVDETDWSKAKVSRVLSKMEADGQVTKIDIGRENVVTLPENVPSSANPPSESEAS